MDHEARLGLPEEIDYLNPKEPVDIESAPGSTTVTGD